MDTKINHFTSEVLVVDAEGNNLGRMRIEEARQLAQSQNLDLIEIGKQDNSLVCKIMDEGRWKYERKKREKSRKQNVRHFKEIKFRMRIDDHDLQTKISHVRKFLDKDYFVKLTVEMRGREKGNPNLAVEKLDKILVELDGYCSSQGVKKSSSHISATVHKNKKVKKKEKNGERDIAENGSQ